MSELKPCPEYQEEINELLRMKKQLLGLQGCSCQSQQRNEWKARCLSVGIYALSQLQIQNRAQPDNAPLTLEELRGMDGEPVYTVPDRYAPGWDVVKILDTGYIRTKVNPYLQENGYGKTWVCYRRKPELEGGDR